MSPEFNSSFKHLKDRAKMLKKVRFFFDERGFTEVDCPALSHFAPIDPHIDLFEVVISSKEKGYLFSSPEYGMKRLLAEGLSDIFQLSHVFRKDELSPLHNPEFTMIEWYRQNISFDTFIEETSLLFAEFLGQLPLETLTYREAFQSYFGLDYTQATPEDLIKQAKQYDLLLSSDSKDNLLNRIWGCLIEPHLGKDLLTLITDYPASQAALAKIKEKNGTLVAERFEIYYKGIELGNGYHELTDPTLQKQQLEKANQERIAMGKKAFPIDPHFLAALEKGLPDCYGIAVGFDRLMMLKHQCSSIHPILPFSWEES